MTAPAERPGSSRRSLSFYFARVRRALHLPSVPQSPLELQLLGKVLLHSALVGAVTGVACSLFYWLLGLAQHLFLERLAGYTPLRAHGEVLIESATPPTFRPWLLWAIPALGALVGGALSLLAPETRGGGSDVIIEAFHRRNGVVRRRVPLIKALASIFNLGSGGSGGREGPTMQIGGALGSIVGRYLRVTTRERRVLLVAGLAAGMSAVFRTPLGAALLAVEIFHRDDFESDALVPSVLASVIAYSVFISFFGESTLFAHAAHYPFFPRHLPLYALSSILVCLFAIAFLTTLRAVQTYSEKLRMPAWMKPALGGLGLGVLSTPIILGFASHVGAPGQGLGLLGGGYGAAQLAITGAPWFPGGWHGVELLLLLGFAKIIASSLTIGTGGSAGDFGPSLVMGGVFGGAIGRAAQLLLHDPTIDPGAFALVGMATFYGGIAHVPLGSLVMTCELAGSYDLLVPLMFAEGIAFVALRNRHLYEAQVPTKRDSPAHRDDLILDILRQVRVGDVVIHDRPYVTFDRNTSAASVLAKVAGSGWQDAFPVLGDGGKVVGVVSGEILRTMTANPELAALAVADDLMTAPTSVLETDDLHAALEVMLTSGVRELVVVDADGKIVGFLDESEITKAYHGSTTEAQRDGAKAPDAT